MCIGQLALDRGAGLRAHVQLAAEKMPDNKRNQGPENAFSPLQLPEKDKPPAKELVDFRSKN